jgi:hypothetical protein
MFPPSNDTPESKRPIAPFWTSLATLFLGQPIASRWVGLVAVCAVGMAAACAVPFVYPDSWASWTRKPQAPEEISEEVLNAIRHEQAAVKRLESLEVFQIRKPYDARFSRGSELEWRVEGLTDGGSLHPIDWEITVDTLTAVEQHLTDLKALRRIGHIRISPRPLTEEALAVVRRLPRTDDLILVLDGSEQTPSGHPAYQLLAGMPFTVVEVREKPLSKPVSLLLPGFPQLDSLWLAYCKEEVEDDVWGDVARCQRLSKLSFHFVHVSDAGMQAIARVPRLQELCFFHAKLGAGGLKLLPATLELRDLTVYGLEGLGDAQLAELDIDPEELHLKDTGVKFEGAGRDWLLSRKRLKHLTVPDFDLSREEASAINKLGGPHIETTSPCW